MDNRLPQPETLPHARIHKRRHRRNPTRKTTAPVKYVSIFSGIEAATVAWQPLGWKPIAFSEIDPFPSSVLQHHYPNIPNLGDITKIDWSLYVGAADIVVGGSPCQSFSIAGKREGLAGASGLMFEYIRAVRELRPRWFVWENVSGALTSERGGGLIASSCQRWMRSGMVWHGEYWMRSFSAWPNAASVCFLLEVLEPCVARKYFLSAKACRGIISRAARRGKPLPKRLRDALERQIMILAA